MVIKVDEIHFTGSITSVPALAKNVVSRTLTRDMFAVCS